MDFPLFLLKVQSIVAAHMKAAGAASFHCYVHKGIILELSVLDEHSLFPFTGSLGMNEWGPCVSLSYPWDEILECAYTIVLQNHLDALFAHTKALQSIHDELLSAVSFPPQKN